MSNPTHVTFLGTGTSQGIPVIGCDCEVCTSADTRDNRLRTSIMVSSGDTNIVVDCGPDFRQQILSTGAKRIHGILFTHEHNDHVAGLDDIRPINFRYKVDMPIYAEARVLNSLTTRYGYIFNKSSYPGVPQIRPQAISPGDKLRIEDIEIEVLRTIHGKLPILGYKFGDIVYLTDTNEIPDATLQIIKKCKVLIIDALHLEEHHSHFNLEESLAAIEKIKPETAYLIHFSHLMGTHESVIASIPKHVHPSYDGLKITIQ